MLVLICKRRIIERERKHESAISTMFETVMKERIKIAIFGRNLGVQLNNSYFATLQGEKKI